MEELVLREILTEVGYFLIGIYHSLCEKHAINCILLIAREVINQGQDEQNKIMESHTALKMEKDI